MKSNKEIKDIFEKFEKDNLLCVIPKSKDVFIWLETYYELKSEILQKEQELKLKLISEERKVKELYEKLNPLLAENITLKKEIERLDKEQDGMLEIDYEAVKEKDNHINKLKSQLQEKINYVNTIDEINAGLEFQWDNHTEKIKKRIEEIIKLAPNNPLDILFGRIWGILNLKVDGKDLLNEEKHNRITFFIKEYLEELKSLLGEK